MNRSLMWRGILILVLVVLAAAAAWPPGEKISLGLDLRGGMHLVLDVQVEDALEAETDRTMQRVVNLAEEEGLSGLSGRRTSRTSFVVSGLTPANRDTLRELVGDELASAAWDWSGSGAEMTFELTDSERTVIRNLAVTQAVQTIRNRVDQYGVTEPVIQRIGMADSRILVQLPGVDDPERVRDLIKNTAFLEFRLVAYPESGRGGAAGSREQILAHYDGRLPDDVEIAEQVIRNEQGDVVGRQYYALEKQQVITGRDLRTARPGVGEFGGPVVLFSLNAEGAGRFGEITGANVGRGLAIVLDGQVVSAPNINSRISDSGQIEGSFTQQEVEDLAMVLRSGALPAGITYLEERTVGPSLGKDSIDQGLRAGLIGGALVVLMMLVVYKLTGINAVVALGLNVVFVFGALGYFGATLTLPGIAGIILVVGMAVDANVLVFERIKEELHVGRTVKSAVDAGFSKALSSVLDANITTLIAALFLFQFGTGPIRGFAVTLSIGILASVFTAIFVSRFLFDLLLSRQRRVEKLSI